MGAVLKIIARMRQGETRVVDEGDLARDRHQRAILEGFEPGPVRLFPGPPCDAALAWQQPGKTTLEMPNPGSEGERFHRCSPIACRSALMKKLPVGAQTKRQGEPQAGEHPTVTVGLTGRVLSSSPTRCFKLQPTQSQPRLRFGLVRYQSFFFSFSFITL